MGVLRKRFFSVDESTGGFSLERFSVKAPAWAKPGDTIEIEAGTAGSRYMWVRRRRAASFEVACRSRARCERRDRAAAAAARVVCTCCPPIWAAAIWTLVTGNYVVRLLRQVVHHPAMWVLGHAVLFLQLGCYLRCQLTQHDHEEVAGAAAAGDEHETCKRTELLLPPRSRYVGRRGASSSASTTTASGSRRSGCATAASSSPSCGGRWASSSSASRSSSTTSGPSSPGMAASLDAKGVDLEGAGGMHRAFGGYVGHAFGGGGANFAGAMLGRNVFTSMVWDSPGIMEMAMAGADVSVVYIRFHRHGALGFLLILLGIFATGNQRAAQRDARLERRVRRRRVGQLAPGDERSRLAWFLPILGDGPAADGLLGPEQAKDGDLV